MIKVLLFDLDGTLLTSGKTISAQTLDTLGKCRNKGLLVGVATSRSRQNSLKATPHKDCAEDAPSGVLCAVLP